MTIPESSLPYPESLARALSRIPLFVYKLGWGRALGWVPLLVMTAEGHETHKHRYVVVEYRRHGSKYYIVSGWGEQTHWYQNLMHNPRVTIQHGSQVYDAVAHRVENPPEVLSSLYMFSRNSWIYETLFARMSSAQSADLSTLAEVVDEFTVVRIDPTNESPKLPPVPLFSERTRQVAFGFALLSMFWIVVSLLRRIVRQNKG
jgi:deazaflavin-dependent oxidoreductase (nitroreductase family)